MRRFVARILLFIFLCFSVQLVLSAQDAESNGDDREIASAGSESSPGETEKGGR